MKYYTKEEINDILYQAYYVVNISNIKKYYYIGKIYRNGSLVFCIKTQNGEKNVTEEEWEKLPNKGWKVWRPTINSLSVLKDEN